MNQFDYMRKGGGALGSKKTNKSDYLIFSQTLVATCVRPMALFSAADNLGSDCYLPTHWSPLSPIKQHSLLIV